MTAVGQTLSTIQAQLASSTICAQSPADLSRFASNMQMLSSLRNRAHRIAGESADGLRRSPNSRIKTTLSTFVRPGALHVRGQSCIRLRKDAKKSVPFGIIETP